MPIPGVNEMIERLIATPSVSSVVSSIDMGNEALTHELANWCRDVGFAVEIMPISLSTCAHCPG